MSTDVVICARNEAATIGAVVDAFRACPNIGRIIVVDDCSTDDTMREAFAHGASVIPGPGMGKGAAMRTGLQFVSTERVIFSDADIVGLTAGDVAELAAPFPGMICGLRDNGSELFGPVPPITGERSLPTAIARATPLGGYGAELALDSAIGRAGLPVRTFTMRGVRNPSRASLRRTAQVLARLPENARGLALYSLAWLTGKAPR